MKPKTPTVTDLHKDWLAQIETDGPFLALPVVKDIWPQGVDRLGDADDRMVTFKQAYVQWQRAFDTYTEGSTSAEARADYLVVNRAWIELVLDRLAGWQDLRLDADDQRLSALQINSPGGEITVRPSGALEGRDGELAVLVLSGDPTSDLRAIGLDGWAATEIDRMAALLRQARVEVGIVTDGQWWAVVWAKDGKPTGSGMVNALTWAEEPLLRDAFLNLVDQHRFRAKDPEQRLPRLFQRSELEAEEITEALGTQVRRSVELLVQAFSEARLAASAAGELDPLTDEPDAIYQGAVTVMMRVVFLLFAEEREMLPTEQLYWSSYAIHGLLDDLQLRAAGGEEHLDTTHDAWHRLLAVSQALFAGVNYDEMRMPAYGGSLLDPTRFPWLHAADSRGLRLKVSDRVMLHVFDSVQSVVLNKERRRISFRDIDVEQIGYIYEGLLGYTCRVVEDDVVLGLIGKAGLEPEIPLGVLGDLYESSTDNRDFATKLLAWVKADQPAATGPTVTALTRLVAKELTESQEAELNRLLTPIAGDDVGLLDNLVSWGELIRRDLRGIPYVIAIGGLVVAETPSRKNAGAHYTPRSLAEEVVKYALEPLVYEPGPLQTSDESAWKLKPSTTVLDLRVADIAAGSGAFLVAAARYLAGRVAEAWTVEGVLSQQETENARLATDRATREVIARCLYGADINPMAVEMCKLSLWLISMNKAKPFSFVDDKIFCGNSLLGLTTLTQLSNLHLYPDLERAGDLFGELFDMDRKIDDTARIRRELASPIDEHDPMRSSRGKLSLLRQAHRITTDLKLVADAIVAAALPLGGKPGPKLDSAYQVLSWELTNAFAHESEPGKQSKLRKRVSAGLTPSVDSDYPLWQPLHWILEAPDVFIDRGGFDAVIGNPPFLVGKKISGAIGSDHRELLVHTIAAGIPGNADLVVYFLLRAAGLVAQERASIGLVTAKVVAEGDSREVGLDSIMARGMRLRRAVSSAAWPGAGVSTRYSVLWGDWSPTTTKPVLDGKIVDKIEPSLESGSRAAGIPRRLLANAAIAYKGYEFGGDSFFVDSAIANLMRSSGARNNEVVRPFLNARDLNSSPTQAGSRWILFFGSMELGNASSYKEPFALLQRRVADQSGRWWQFRRPVPALTTALAKTTGAIAIAIVSPHAVPVIVSGDAVMGSAIAVWPTNDFGLFALLSSSVHSAWIRRWASRLGESIRYTVTDVFETFPRPQLSEAAQTAGRQLDSQQRKMMRGRQIGLTALYNLINDRNIESDSDLDLLRERHIAADEAIMTSYGWPDLSLDHGFYTYRRVERWTISPSARVEVLDRLLELNHELARQEGHGKHGR